VDGLAGNMGAQSQLARAAVVAAGVEGAARVAWAGARMTALDAYSRDVLAYIVIMLLILAILWFGSL
jgi:histidine ammonia-lyase